MLAERGLPDEPLFCFETALKMSYFCMHIYRHFNVSCWCCRGAVCKGLLCAGCRVVGCSEWRTCNWVYRLGRLVRNSWFKPWLHMSLVCLQPQSTVSSLKTALALYNCEHYEW